MTTIFQTIQSLGLLGNFTEDIKDLQEGKQTPCNLYIGFDPTSESLHVGSLVGIVTAIRLLLLFNSKVPHEQLNHSVIFLVGGATGLIGDPSGKSFERTMLDISTVNQNVISVTNQLKGITNNILESMPFSSSPIQCDLSMSLNQNVKFVNNATWLKDINLIDFLRDVGKHFRVNTMLTKDSVKSRIESESGISFAEFTYGLFQAYDFAHLAKTEGCNLQIGGSDQWGNIVSGVDLAKKMFDLKVHGMTFPLMTGKDGKKFGKTESGAIWLDKTKTTIFDFYQFWINLSDEEAKKLLPQLVIFSIYKNENAFIIKEMLDSAEKNPEKRILQEILAFWMTTIVHGSQVAQQLGPLVKTLFSKDLNVSTLDFEHLSKFVPFKKVTRESMGLPVYSILPFTGLVVSKTEGRNLLRSKSISINGREIGEKDILTKDMLINDKFILVRKGKKEICLIQVDEEGIGEE